MAAPPPSFSPDSVFEQDLHLQRPLGEATSFTQLKPLSGAHADMFGWKTDLAASEVHWRGWFEGLSALFLAVGVPKMLILAGSDRLDTPLTVAQMQGKFQYKLLYGCGHTVQEDNPAETADALLAFVARLGLVVQPGTQSEQAKLLAKLARAKTLKPRVS